ncbi:hypothetical protein [Paenibacillus chitinolyticus]|uniref:hypothetical protein n=1 Tax=Paenibacillus chitinolyticus TaxID=79263 RepID=UPI003D025E59
MNTVNRSELQKKYGDERVLVVSTQQLEDSVFNPREGFSIPIVDTRKFLSDIGFFADRWQVEHNTVIRQPIPYILVKSKGRFFATKRLPGAGEDRLFNKISMGVGGHINPEDEDGVRDIFTNGMFRELHEELWINGKVNDWKFTGVINDKTNPVSQDHIALVYVVDVGDHEVSVKENDKLDGKFYSIQELLDHHDQLESWSQILLEMIVRGYIK